LPRDVNHAVGPELDRIGRAIAVDVRRYSVASGAAPAVVATSKSAPAQRWA